MRASRLPLSIIVVGIGGEDFSNMQGLGSSKLGSVAAGFVERDVVGFAAFGDVAHDGSALAAQLLAKLPGQFLAYMRWDTAGFVCTCVCGWGWGGGGAAKDAA